MTVLLSCSKDGDSGTVKNPIGISSPTPARSIDRVLLDDTQKSCVKAGNEFAFRCLRKLYEDDNASVVMSPLSLQYALAMTANGASGQTQEEITGTLGFGGNIAAMNALCNLLLNQLPAVDTDATLKLANAIIVNDWIKVREAYKDLIEKTYYAPVEYMKTSDVSEVVKRINEWASRNTNGVISPFITKQDIPADLAAAILNALYFKAAWQEHLFDEDNTLHSQPFYYDGGGVGKEDLMRTSGIFEYADLPGFCALRLPFKNGKFSMYVLLPKERGGNGAAGLIDDLTEDLWSSTLSSMSNASVQVRIPRFEVKSHYDLVDMLESLGILRAFIPGVAEFDELFDKSAGQDDLFFWIDKVIQQAKINVTEYGIEAAAASMVSMVYGSDANPWEDHVEFNADHPFVFLITENSSGVILFEGVFTGE